ncbi:uncharacterized protein si:dkey-237j10.2 [Neolamprologus brichardi]|uniref:uncharacterized protein si:dkey-237j10.2 n=1 Tax=Neolamprologus brichardi TaxID=32507 RepID=UPI0003EC5564|nr:uncharacterized protein si:dkey-237j10.2 [Neolamprologus brichardi]
MLAEGFLRLLVYREERKFASNSKQKRLQTSGHCADPSNCARSDSSSAVPGVHSAEAGIIEEDLNSSQPQILKVVPQRPVALSIPTDLYPLYIEDCSLLEQYPDLQVADSGRITHNLLRTAVSQHDFCIQSPISQVCPSTAQQEPQNSVPSIPDQGYLAMGDSVNISLDLPGSGLEPMSNSVLNGLLEKQLEEVYMQHLTENLARCNSHLGNSLLHGLVPPPQPSSQSEGADSLLGCMDKSTEDSSSKISYLNTHNLVPCSSNFSSPVLRISEAENPHPQ